MIYAEEVLEWADTLYCFVVQWNLLAADGQVDDFGSVQFGRVLTELALEASPPGDCLEFILSHRMDESPPNTHEG